MKRYSSVIICVVLLVCTLFLLPSTAKNEVTVGKGNGKNEKINTVEDLIGMLYCIQRGDYDATLSVNTKALETEESKEVIASLLAFSMGSNDSEEKSAGDTQRLVAQSDKDDEDEEEPFAIFVEEKRNIFGKRKVISGEKRGMSRGFKIMILLEIIAILCIAIWWVVMQL